MKRLGWNVSYILLLCSMTCFQTDHDIVSLLFTPKKNSAETCTRSTKQFLSEKPYEAYIYMYGRMKSECIDSMSLQKWKN